MKTTRTRQKQAAPRNPTGIFITPAEGDMMRQRAAATGQSVEQFAAAAIREGIAKLDPARLLSIPCPFCRGLTSLEIIAWSSQRPDGTEYQGDAVKCHRCEAITPIAAWACLVPVQSQGGAK